MLLRCESLEPPMSQLGQERRIGAVRNISALPPNVLQNSVALGDRVGDDFLAVPLSSSPDEGVTALTHCTELDATPTLSKRRPLVAAHGREA
jgi:hypothetical protein